MLKVRDHYSVALSWINEPGSTAAVHVIDFYLQPEHEKERVHILQLVQSQDAGSTELLRGYVREGMREN